MQQSRHSFAFVLREDSRPDDGVGSRGAGRGPPDAYDARAYTRPAAPAPEFDAPGVQPDNVHSEGDAEALVLDYLRSLGVQTAELRAQQSFSIRVGRTVVHKAGEAVEGWAVRGARLDFRVANAEGRPLFVVELKASSQPLSDDDRDQGVCYARLLHPMAPVVVVTNTRQTRLYDTVTKEEIGAVADAQLTRGGQLTADDDLRARYEALQHFFGYSAANVAAFSRAQRERTMRGLRGGDGHLAHKYEPALYLRRPAARAAVDAFLASPDVVFALGGYSGFGKTNELCAIAEELGASDLVLFFNGGDLAGPLPAALADEFNWTFSESLALPHICRRLDGIAAAGGCRVLVVVDAVDEATVANFAQDLGAFASQLAAFGGRMRLLVSAKVEEWPAFAARRGVPTPLRQHVFVPPGAGARSTPGDAIGPDGAGNSGAEGQDADERGGGGVRPDERMSAVLGPLDDGERDAALAHYTRAFGLSGSWSDAMRELARDPFMLRVAAEVGRDAGAIPTDPGGPDLVRRYVDAKLERTADRRRARAALAAVARAFVAPADAPGVARADDAPAGIDGGLGRRGARAADRPGFSVPEGEVRAAAGVPTAGLPAGTADVVDELVAFGLLTRTADPDDHTRLAFAYDRVRDYVVASEVYGLARLPRGGFRDAALACFGSGPGLAALRWHLPHAAPEQWDGFVDAATERLGRFVDAHEAIRAHLAPSLRAQLERGPAGPLGAVFAVDRDGWMWSALFRRTSASTPRVCHDWATFRRLQDWAAPEGRILRDLVWGASGGRGLRVLRAPERVAAEQVLAALLKAVKDGRLDERGDAYLVAERVVALAVEYERTLGLAPIPDPTPHAPGAWLFADRYVARHRFPLDVADVLRRALEHAVFQQYESRDSQERAAAERRRYQDAGQPVPAAISFAATGPELQHGWRDRAAQEVAARGDAVRVAEDAGLGSLVASARRLLPLRPVVPEPLLPPPDVRDRDRVPTFDGAYSDAQLAHLLEHIFGRAREAYARVAAASFSPALEARLRGPGNVTLIVCDRRLDPSAPSTPFHAAVWYGPATPADANARVPDGQHAVAVVVTPGQPSPVHVEPDDWSYTVDTRYGRFCMATWTGVELGSIVAPYDAPRMAHTGVRHAHQFAPVRALTYAWIGQALKALRADDLMALAAGPAA